MNGEQIQRALINAIDTGNKEQVRYIIGSYPQVDLSGLDLFLLGRGAYLIDEWEIAEQLYMRAEREELPDWCRGANASAMALLCQKKGVPEQALPYYEESLRYKTPVSGLWQEYSNYLFNLYYLNKSNEFMLTAARRYQETLAGIKPLAVNFVSKVPHRKIRIGYVTPDVDRHIVCFFSYALWRFYNRDDFDVYIYTTAPASDVSAEVKSWVKRVMHVSGYTIVETARLIRQDEIDILVDLAGHTAGNMLPVFACRPAPIQISGIGYLGTTGMKAMDYFLADVYTMPDTAKVEDEFCEKVIRLPHSHLCYMWHDAPPPVSELPSVEKPYITFGSMNQWPKINDEVLTVWAQIMQLVPQSHLLLKTTAFSVKYVQKLAIERMQRAGIDVSRIELQPATADYLSVYHNIDIALDSFPYPGGGTTCDALYMGVPVITLRGKRHNARFGVSLLSNIGMQELIADSLDDYVSKAVLLARNKSRLADMRKKLRNAIVSSPIMNTKKYMDDMENLYRQLHGKLQKGKT